MRMAFGRGMERAAKAGFDQVEQTPVCRRRGRALGLVLNEEANVVQRPDPTLPGCVGARVALWVEVRLAAGGEGLEIGPPVSRSGEVVVGQHEILSSGNTACRPPLRADAVL